MREARRGKIINMSNGAVICAQAQFADSLRLRLCGLLGSDGLAADAGLLLAPSSGVHTFGMRFPIDIIAMDKHFRILGSWEMVGPGKVRALGLRTRNVLELKGGRLQGCAFAVGDRLVFQPTAECQQSVL